MKLPRTYYLVEFTKNYVGCQMYWHTRDLAQRFLQHKQEKYKAVGEVIKVKEVK